MAGIRPQLRWRTGAGVVSFVEKLVGGVLSKPGHQGATRLIRLKYKEMEDIQVERYAKFRPLTETSRDNLHDSFRSMGAALIDANERTRIHFRLIDGGKRADWTLDTIAKGAKVQDKRVGTAKLEIVSRIDTWSDIARGKLSPLEAFVTGRLRARGDLEMAKRLLRHLCEPEGRFEIC